MNSEKTNAAVKDQSSISAFLCERTLRTVAVAASQCVLTFALLSALLLMATQAVEAQTESVLHSFAGGADGRIPEAGLVRDKSGNLYGTTYRGGTYDDGTVFKVAPDGTETVLHSFGLDGYGPLAPLILDGKGNLYGTTFYGGTSGAGVVFKVTPTGTETTLYSFSGGADGGYPLGGVVRGLNGKLYGTTRQGGAFGNGTVFGVTLSGKETVIYSFTGGADGSLPQAGLVRDAQGNLYGTTRQGGAFNYGTVFEVTPSGTMTVLHSFAGGDDGQYSYASLVRDANGNLYGTTYEGGGITNDCPNGCGTIFEVTPAGTETVLHRFGYTDGFPLYGLIRDGKGNLYGVTRLVFKLTPAGNLIVLYTWSYPYVNGAFPVGELVRDTAGNLYGATYYGGAYLDGVVYKLTP